MGLEAGVGDAEGDGDGVGSAAAAGAEMAATPMRAITIARPMARMLLLDAKMLPSDNHGEEAMAILGSAEPAWSVVGARIGCAHRG